MKRLLKKVKKEKIVKEKKRLLKEYSTIDIPSKWINRGYLKE